MLLIRENEVRQLLPMETAIGLVRESFLALGREEALNQPRRRMHVSGGSVLHSMAGAWGKYFGTKVYTTNVRHGAHFLFLLCDAATAKPLALFEANYLGQIRTGAATGLATDLLALPEASSLGVIGSGFQARSQVEAILAVRPVSRIRVWSRDAKRRQMFAKNCDEQFRVPVTASETAREAVSDAAMVVTATYSAEPVIEDEWIAAGTHVNAIGSNNPSRRELPAGLVHRADLIVVDSLEQARAESGDLLLAAPAESWGELPLVELAAVARREAGRTTNRQVTIFKSNGLGLEDVAVGGYVYEKALERSIGAEMDFLYS